MPRSEALSLTSPYKYGMDVIKCMSEDLWNVKKNLAITLNMSKICIDGNKMGRKTRCSCDFYEKKNKLMRVKSIQKH